MRFIGLSCFWKFLSPQSLNPSCANVFVKFKRPSYSSSCSTSLSDFLGLIAFTVPRFQPTAAYQGNLILSVYAKFRTISFVGGK